MTRPSTSVVDDFVIRLVYLARAPIVAPVFDVLLRMLGVFVPRQVQIGRELRLPHVTVGLVVHSKTVIGDRVTLFHNVTIGRADVADMDPAGISGVVLEDDVVAGAGAALLQRPGHELVIGRGAVIGANAVVTRSVPAGETWAGAPARRVG